MHAYDEQRQLIMSVYVTMCALTLKRANEVLVVSGAVKSAGCMIRRSACLGGLKLLILI